MKRWLAIIFLLFSTSAWAQNPTCPTRPPGDSSNACASTAFVQNATGTAIPFTNLHFTQTGTGAVDETLDTIYRSKIFYPEMFGGSCTSTDAGPGIQRAINAAGGLSLGPAIVQLAPCGYTVITPVVDSFGVRLIGASNGGTFFIFAPTTNNQIAYRVRNVGNIVTGGSVENIFFYTNDTTRTKVAIEVEDVSHFTFSNVRIGGATVGLASLWGGGGNSVGLRTRGREFIQPIGLYIAAEIPISIAKNPNSTNDLDFSNFQNINTIAAASSNNIVMDDALSLTRNTFSSVSMSGGSNCIYWINSTGIIPSDGNTFNDMGCEQGNGTVGYNYIIEGNATGLIRNLTLSGYQLLDNVRNGPIFRNVQNLNIAGSMFYQGISPLLCMDVDTSVRGMSWRNSLFQGCSTANFLGQTKISAATLNAGDALPNWANYASTLDSAVLVGASGAIAGSATAPLVLNSTTGVLTCPTCATSGGGGSISGVSPIAVSAGGVISFAPAGTSNGVLYNSVGTLGNTAAGTNGQLFLGVTSSAPNWRTMSGDATITNTGVLTLDSTIARTNTGQTFTGTNIFSVLSASTSITTPLYYGGSGAASTLTLGSTSGAGTTDAIIGQTASQVERFRVTTAGLFNIGPAITPDTLLTVNSNTGTSVASSAIGGTAQAHLIAPDTTIGGVVADVYGAQGVYANRHSSGTQASKTASVGATQTFSFAAQHWDTTAYFTSAGIDFGTLNTQSTTDHSGFLRVRTVATGSTTSSERLRVQQGLSVGNTTDPGVGVVSATGGYVSNGLAGISTVCTIAVGNVLTFTLGILTAKGGTAGCT